MDFELWGAQAAPLLEFPPRPIGLAVWLALAGLAFLFTWQYGRRWTAVSRQQWLTTAGLMVAAFVLAQLMIFPLPSLNILPLIDQNEMSVRLLHLLAGIPLIIAALGLPAGPAALVGFASGLSRSLWQSGSIYDPFIYAVVAIIVSWAVHQRYRGPVYRLLRQPLIIGILTYLVIVPVLSGWSAGVYIPREVESLVALDFGVTMARNQWLPALIEGSFASLIGWLLAFGLPFLNPTTEKAEDIPWLSRTLTRRLISRFLIYSVVLILGLGFLVFNVSIYVARNLIVEQMAHTVSGVNQRIGEFRDIRSNILRQYSSIPDLQSDDGAVVVDSLERLHRTGNFFRRVMVVDAADPDQPQAIIAAFPEGDSSLTLSNQEKLFIDQSLAAEGAPVVTPSEETADGQSTISFITMIPGRDENSPLALIGRINESSLSELTRVLEGTALQGSGFIIDNRDIVIAHPDPTLLQSPWKQDPEGIRLVNNLDLLGRAYEGVGPDSTRHLIYEEFNLDNMWTIVVIVPYKVVLEQAVDIGRPFLLLATIATVVFVFFLVYLSREVTQPLNNLLFAARNMTEGDYTPIDPQAFGFDEVGELGIAFERMQRTLSARLGELSLLLDVSQNVSASLNRLSEGALPLLRGAVRGTGASGARIAVVNPSGRLPLTYGAGPAAERMAAYDRVIMRHIQQKRELILPNEAAVRTQFEMLPHEDVPFKSVVAIGLISQNRFNGVLWLTYRQPHEFDESELRLLRTLAGQASVLLENVHLFANAEGGRRRLLAVLESTDNAVIVTDSTNRIALLNPAMEKAFGLKSKMVRGRRVADIIKQPELVNILTARDSTVHSAEIALASGKTYSASASAITISDGQIQGRVAVLHDITYMKELDEMKSNFVQMVSHDLRSPLTYMTGFVSMLPMAGDLNDKQMEYVYKIQNGIEQMNALVKNLLDLGRLEAGLELMRSPVFLSEILQVILNDYQPLAEANGVRLAFESEGKIPQLQLDYALVQQAIANLVSNAIKYAPNSGEITLKTELTDREVVVSVSDRGPGIPLKDQSNLYEKFVRGKTLTRQVKGSGLGLAIVRTVAERHGGQAWFESAQNQGSTFYISFPLKSITTPIVN